MISKKRTVFFGTPDFAVPILESLFRETQVAVVVSQPDRPSGRGRKLVSPPVKTRAIELGIECLQPEIVKGKRFAARIAEYSPDFIITAAFGRILGPTLLNVPKMESLNVHASLLPRHRGAAPINWAILRGDHETGISIMRMEQGLDTGPVYNRVSTPILADETAGELFERLAQLGAQALIDTINRFDALKAVPQNHSIATKAPMLEKADGVIDWTKTAKVLANHVCGMSPWPCAFSLLNGELFKVYRAIVSDDISAQGMRPGQVVQLSRKGVFVACGNGVLQLLELQVASRKRLNAEQFLAGTNIEIGVQLGK
jgi:methionyl-tRNA formyltransferase